MSTMLFVFQLTSASISFLFPTTVTAQTAQQPLAKDYFVRQGNDEDLLITINAFEAGFESRVSAQNGILLLHSVITESRIVPVFQYVTAPEEDRQLDIQVSSNQHTQRTEFGLELTRLKIWDERSSSISRAYQQLSVGMLVGGGGSAANWSVKIESLISAGRLFQKFGMKEMRLWANYLAAHLIQYHLHDHSIVYSMTGEILAEVEGTRLQKIELATLQLHSAALIGLKRSGSLNMPLDGFDPVQLTLSRASQLASSMGFDYEQALALNSSGVEYAAGSLFSQALEQFQKAVTIADSVGDANFANAIRERIVEIHASQGDDQASSQVLQTIEARLIKDGAGDELALNLLAQGRLLIRSYLYDQAKDVLLEALNYENNSAIRRQVNFELAKVLYETGRLDESIAYLRVVDISPENNPEKRLNSIVDTGEGLRVLANIQRTRGDYAAMRNARKAEGLYHSRRALYLYEQGLDERETATGNQQSAMISFRQSHAMATRKSQPDVQHLARLQLCALGSNSGGVCSEAGIADAYDWLLVAGIPRFAMEAMYLRAQIYDKRGQDSTAISVMAQLVSEIHLLRQSLPGVLGAWYRQRHEEVFEYYLNLLGRDSARQGRASGLDSLLALSKIRYIEKLDGGFADNNDSMENTDLLRAQLAQRANISPSQNSPGLSSQINRGMQRLRQSFEKEFEYLSRSGLEGYLKGLSKDEVVLTFHISPTTAQVWLGRKSGVQRRNIDNPAYIYAALQDARRDLEGVGIASFRSKMTALGERLIGPLASTLPRRVYWIAAGSLMGFPLDALRVNERYLIENHTIVNLLSFPAVKNTRRKVKMQSPVNVFVAGYPQDYSGDIATRLETSEEIRTVAGIFVGPGLTIVQGGALLPDEFQSESFRQAQLIHLTMPGRIDLKFPVQSSLELSGSEFEPGRTSLTSNTIRTQRLTAGLVYLTATQTKNQPLSGFNSQPGLVADFINAGANAVIARIWENRGEIDPAFITRFYRQLEASGDIAESLAQSKREYLRSERGADNYGWAGIQLYTD